MLLTLCYNSNMADVLRIHADDNVGVAITAIGTIRPGHKVALNAIPAGSNVIKYGWPIGRATCDIAAGEWGF